MSTVNVIQIMVYEIYSLSVLRLFLPCKTKNGKCTASGYKIHKTSEEYTEDIILFMLKCLTFDDEFWR